MLTTKAGIIGLGGIGETHLKAILQDPSIQVVGVTDVNQEGCRSKAEKYKVPFYATHIELLEKAKPDYVVICTPHYQHAQLSIDAMKRGVHVLCEKPLSVSAAEAQECVDVAKKTGMVLAVNFMQRMSGAHNKMHELVAQGFVGKIIRVTMVRTAWFRSMAYYRSSPWRATWDGEGGGVSVNQSPHDLDFLCWTAGLPSATYAEMNTLGHDIEVEDDCIALFKWAHGATGTLHITTNEHPGSSYVEIAGTKGSLLLQGHSLKATQLVTDSAEFCLTTQERFAGPAVLGSTTYDIPATDNFLRMSQNMVAAIRTGAQPVCTGAEALREVELANALLISAVKQKWVGTPVDHAEFDHILGKLKDVKKLAKAKEYFRNK